MSPSLNREGHPRPHMQGKGDEAGSFPAGGPGPHAACRQHTAALQTHVFQTLGTPGHCPRAAPTSCPPLQGPQRVRLHTAESLCLRAPPPAEWTLCGRPSALPGNEEPVCPHTCSPRREPRAPAHGRRPAEGRLPSGPRTSSRPQAAVAAPSRSERVCLGQDGPGHRPSLQATWECRVQLQFRPATPSVRPPETDSRPQPVRRPDRCPPPRAHLPGLRLLHRKWGQGQAEVRSTGTWGREPETCAPRPGPRGAVPAACVGGARVLAPRTATGTHARARASAGRAPTAKLWWPSLSARGAGGSRWRGSVE